MTDDFWSSKEKPSEDIEMKELEEEEEEEEEKENTTEEREGEDVKNNTEDKIEETIDDEKQEEEESKMETQDDQQKPTASVQLPQETIKNLAHLLDELYHMLKGVESNLMLLPPKVFPIKNLGVEQQSSHDVFLGVARMLKQK